MIGWLSATIARSVYPPPKRWQSRDKAPLSVGNPKSGNGVAVGILTSVYPMVDSPNQFCTADGDHFIGIREIRLGRPLLQ